MASDWGQNRSLHTASCVFFCVKQQKVPATDEITGSHENQITPKQIILATEF